MSPNHGFVYAALNRETLLRIVTEGHDIGDHSFNHMKVMVLRRKICPAARLFLSI